MVAELLDLEASGMIPPIAEEVRAELTQMVKSWVPAKGQQQMVRPRMAVPGRVGP